MLLGCSKMGLVLSHRRGLKQARVFCRRPALPSEPARSAGGVGRYVLTLATLPGAPAPFAGQSPSPTKTEPILTAAVAVCTCRRPALPSEPARSDGGVGGLRQRWRPYPGRLRRHSPGKAHLPQKPNPSSPLR